MKSAGKIYRKRYISFDSVNDIIRGYQVLIISPENYTKTWEAFLNKSKLKKNSLNRIHSVGSKIRQVGTMFSGSI